MQNDFVDPGGSLYVRGAEQLAPAINAEIERATGTGALVVFTQDWHPPSTPHFQKDGGIWPVHCVKETLGARLYPAIHQPPGAEVIRKGTEGQDGYSGFTLRDPTSGKEGATGLEELLRARGIEKVVIVGVATDYCVKQTLDAVRKGFRASVAVRGVRPVELNSGDGERALEEMRRSGVQLE